MQGPPLAARWIVRITGVIQLVLGLIIWTGSADALIPIHILDGLVFVIALLALAWFASQAGVSAGLVGVTVILAIVLPVYGIAQSQILPGSGHVVIQVIHLALGVAAMGLGDMLGRRTGSTAAGARG